MSDVMMMYKMAQNQYAKLGLPRDLWLEGSRQQPAKDVNKYYTEVLNEIQRKRSPILKILENLRRVKL
jgi:hypothetical protein